VRSGAATAFRIAVGANPAPTTLAVNSHFDPGWRTDVGTLDSIGGGLRLRVPPGSHEVRLRYWPRTLSAGLLLSASGLLGAVAFLRFTSARGGPCRR
jgi:hypothetical protein